jgi:3-hydroxyisobutyrate dehydrogenase
MESGAMVGVIGLGSMGGAMARRLSEQGLVPLVWDAMPEALARAAGRPVARPAGAGSNCVILSLPDHVAVGATLAALWPALPPGAVVVDTSTLSPIAARGFAEEAAARGFAYLDAPVSGGPAGAAAGSLTMMIGGDADALERARPVLALLTGRIVHIGPAGAGQVAKLVNNLLLATHQVVAAEALRLGARAGLAPETLLPVINAATGRSAATEVNWPRWIAPGTFDSGFSVGLMRKDVRLALELAEAVGAPLDACAAAARGWAESAVPDSAEFNRVPYAIFQAAND